MGKLLVPICLFVGHDNATDDPGRFLIKCRRCGKNTPYRWFNRIQSIPYKIERSFLWLANFMAKHRDTPTYWPQYRAIDQQLKGIGTKHSCGAYSYEGIVGLLKQYEGDGLPEPLLSSLISEEGWYDLDEHPEMVQEVIDDISRGVTLLRTKEEQEELNKL